MGKWIEAARAAIGQGKREAGFSCRCGKTVLLAQRTVHPVPGTADVRFTLDFRGLKRMCLRNSPPPDHTKAESIWRSVSARGRKPDSTTDFAEPPKPMCIHGCRSQRACPGYEV